MLEPADAALVARAREGLVATRVHLNHAGASLVPPAALDRMLGHLRREAEIGGYEAGAEAGDELAALPATLAPLLGPTVRPDEVTASESASRAWEAVLWSMAMSAGWREGDRVVVDEFTYATVHSSLMALRRAIGVAVDVAPSGADTSVDPDRLASVVDERTRLVVVTHMPTHVGTVADLAGVGEVLAGLDVVYAVDVSQTLGQMPLDVRSVGAQVAFAPGRKFLRAPRGTAVLFVAAELAEQLVPLTPDLGAVDPDGDTFTLGVAVRRFDTFEAGVAGRLGLGEAARVATATGLDTIARLVADRSAAVVAGLGEIDGVRLLAPDPVGIVSFVHDRLEPTAVRDLLGAEGVNVWVNPAGGSPIDGDRRPVLPSVRISPHYVTDDADLEQLDRALVRLR